MFIVLVVPCCPIKRRHHISMCCKRIISERKYLFMVYRNKRIIVNQQIGLVTSPTPVEVPDQIVKRKDSAEKRDIT